MSERGYIDRTKWEEQTKGKSNDAADERIGQSERIGTGLGKEGKEKSAAGRRSSTHMRAPETIAPRLVLPVADDVRLLWRILRDRATSHTWRKWSNVEQIPRAPPPDRSKGRDGGRRSDDDDDGDNKVRGSAGGSAG